MMRETQFGAIGELATGSWSEHFTEIPCESCRINCRSVQGSRSQPCLVKNCPVCVGVAVLDDKISATYEHLANLVQMRKQIIESHRVSFIQRLPAEILSMIFVSLGEEYMEEVECGEPPFEMLWFKVPTPLPYLLVSSVCKRWRELALNNPRLWTEIVVDLAKSVDCQLWMIREWARRSSPLPLNLTVFIADDDFFNQEEPLEIYPDVVETLRSLAGRWKDLALQAPWSFCHKLLHELEEESFSIRSMFYVQDHAFRSEVLTPVKLLHPLCPRRLICHNFLPLAIPFEWSRLAHLDISSVSVADLLNIISNAPNLTYCAATRYICPSSDQEMSIFPRYITSRSITYLEANRSLLDRLTLPSLQTLEYVFWDHPPEADPFVEFINRSLPPLQTLYLRTHQHWNSEFASCFGKLSSIIDLNIRIYGHDTRINDFLQTLTECSADNDNVVFPGLQELDLSVCSVSHGSWSYICHLFQQGPPPDPPAVEGKTAFVGSFRRPLSKVNVTLENQNYSFDLKIDKPTLLRLLEIRNSGVELGVWNINGFSLLDLIVIKDT